MMLVLAIVLVRKILFEFWKNFWLQLFLQQKHNICTTLLALPLFALPATKSGEKLGLPVC